MFSSVLFPLSLDDYEFLGDSYYLLLCFPFIFTELLRIKRFNKVESKGTKNTLYGSIP